MLMYEIDVLNAFLARMDNYGVTSAIHQHGQYYHLVMNGEQHNAVLLTHSFHYYEKRYHLADERPTLIICHTHDTVLPVPVLSVRAGNFARAYELPESVYDMEQQRYTKVGSQVLLGAYISGLKSAQVIVNNLPPSTRGRYFLRAKELCRRKRGRPVGTIVKQAS